MADRISPPVASSLPGEGLCRVCNQEIRNRPKNAVTCLAHAHVRTRPRQRSKNRGRQMDKAVRWRKFIALDGEGMTPKGRDDHLYTLLAASTGNYIQNRKDGLSTEECLDFLLSLGKGSKDGAIPIYVWFAMDYDVNMILGDIPLKEKDSGDSPGCSIEKLRENGEIHYLGYTIRYWHRKILQVARGKQVFTSYDLWGFYQSTFEGALRAWGIEGSPIIAEGKAARGDFTKWTNEKIRAYNREELRLLVELANALRVAIQPLEIKMFGWHGPAALAGYWLKKHGVKKFQSELSPNLLDVATRAYFGGRIDVKGYGFVDPCYHYDITSAYPSATRKLPDLSKLEWRRTRNFPPESPVYCARIRWDIPDPETIWAPFPWRHSNGNIRYPLDGEGWYWYPEIEACLRKYGQVFEVIDCYEAVGDIEYPLEKLIEETFKYRLEMKRAGHASHIPIKLILNSIYGKFAQTVGKATFYNAAWAGLITSHTRAELMRAITDDTVCVMTDSVWSAKPLTHLDLSGELGAWQQEEENRLVIAEAGLYEAYTPDGKKNVWQRGFDRTRPVDIREIVDQWINGDPGFSPTYTVNRFIGMGLASITSHPWRQWRDLERQIHPVPIVGTSKRYGHYPNEIGTLTDGFMALPIREADTDELSSPYQRVVDLVNIPENERLLHSRLEDECEE